MEVVSHCGFPVGGRVWQPRQGAYALTLVCKATFTLAPGKLAVAVDQEPVNESDRPWSDQVTSLYAASDLAPHKPRPDVVLIGNAYAPGGAPVRKLTARLAVSDVDKSIDVWCERALRPDGSIVDGAPFSTLPLLYERAAGGPGTDNPVGLAPVRDAYGSVALPNLTAQGARIVPDVPLKPACFAPIAANWPGRVARLGHRANELLRQSWLDKPVPTDLDMGYFNVAPADQQPAALRGNDRLLLENLHRDHAKLVTTLPVLRLQAQVTGTARDGKISMLCDTLWIDTSRGVCCLTFRAQVPLTSASDPVSVVVTLEASEADDARPPPPSNPEKVETRPPPPPPPRRVAQTMAFDLPQEHREPASSGGAPRAALPFQAPAEAPAAFRRETPRALPIPTIARSTPWAQPPPATPPAIVPSVSSISLAPQVESPWSLANIPSPAGPGALAPVASVKIPQPVPGDFRGDAGALAASNAAADIRPVAPQAEPPRRSVAPALPPRAAMSSDPQEALDPLFFDAASVPRMRRVAAWKPILAKLEDTPLDAEEDDPQAAKEPELVEDRREVVELLVRAEPTDAFGVDAALARAVRSDGRFLAPLVLLSGELSTPFDEVEALKATLTTVMPLAGNDENLRAAVEIAKEFLKLPGLSSSPAVAEGLTSRVREAFNGAKRTVQPGYLDAQTERALIEQRAYQHRTVLGGRRQRALFHFGSEGGGKAGQGALVAYLPDDAAPKLPLYARFRVRMIARVHLPIDPNEQGAALETLALARLCKPLARPSGR